MVAQDILLLLTGVACRLPAVLLTCGRGLALVFSSSGGLAAHIFTSPAARVETASAGIAYFVPGAKSTRRFSLQHFSSWQVARGFSLP
jgi:hypothetical protein